MLAFKRRFDDDDDDMAQDYPQDEFEMAFPKIGNIDERVDHYVKAFRTFLLAVGFGHDTIDKYTVNTDECTIDEMITKYENTLRERDTVISSLKEEVRVEKVKLALRTTPSIIVSHGVGADVT